MPIPMRSGKAPYIPTSGRFMIACMTPCARLACMRSYSHPLTSDCPYYCDLSSASDEQLPVARCAANSIIRVPIRAGMTHSEVLKVVGVIRANA